MSESIWKKELRLRRRPEPLPPFPERLLAHSAPSPPPAAESGGTEEASAAKGAKDSFWKKERTLRRRPEPSPPLSEALLSRHRPAPRGVVVLPVVPNAEAHWPSVDAQVETEEPVDEPIYKAPEAEQTLELPSLAAWDEQVEPEPISHPVFAKWAAESAEVVPAFLADAVPSKPRREPAAEQVPEEVELDPEPIAETTAVEAEKVRLLKREIHLGRPRREKPAKPAKAEKPAKAMKPAKAKKPAKIEVEKADSAAKVPLLKREIQFGRRPKAASALGKDAEHKVTRVVGLRIGSTQLAAAHVRNNGSAEVMQLARVPLDRGLIVGGEVREPVALAKALKSFFAENKLPKKDIRLGIASNRIGVRVLDVPGVDDPKQFENAIRFRAQEVLPIPIVEAVLDHVVVGEEVDGEGETIRRVLLVFAHRELVSQYVDVCRHAGLRLAGIDLDAFALLRAIGPRTDSEGRRASVVVAIGHERTVFAVSDGELCEFTRVFEWGSNAIDVAIARALNLSPSQAEPLKAELDLAASEPSAGLSPMQFEVARSAVTGEIGHLVRELLSSLRFYQSQSDSLDLHEVVLSGGGAQLSGLAAEIQRGLGVPVRVGDPFGRVSLAKRVQTPESAGSYAVAVGLGIDA